MMKTNVWLQQNQIPNNNTPTTMFSYQLILTDRFQNQFQLSQKQCRLFLIQWPDDVSHLKVKHLYRKF